MLEGLNVASYVDYFRWIAENNSSLQHNPAGETGDGDQGSVHFTRWTADEILTGLRSKVGFPCLMLELYETDTRGDAFDIDLRPQGAFSIIDRADNNFDSEMAAFTNAESITREVLQQIWNDHYAQGADRCTSPLLNFDFEKLNISPVGPILDNCFGYRVLFSFRGVNNWSRNSMTLVDFDNSPLTTK